MSANERRPDAPLVRFSNSPQRQSDSANGSFVAATETPFPQQRSILWTPEAVRRAEPGKYELVVSQDVLVGVNTSVGASLATEIGGFLLGNKYRCPNSGREYVVIDQFTPAAFTESSSVSLMFTAEAWGNLSDELEGKFRGKELVGWYHSHPKMEVFLSSTDVELHTQRFPEPWMTALVVEPQKGLAGFFVWNSGVLDVQRGVPFHELLDPVSVQTRTTHMSWTNYSGVDGLTGTSVQHAARVKTAVVERPGPDSQKVIYRAPSWLLIAACALLVIAVGLGAALAFKSGPVATPTVVHYSLSASDPLRPALANSVLTLNLHVDGEGDVPLPKVKVDRADATVTQIKGQKGDFKVEVPKWRDSIKPDARAMENADSLFMKKVTVQLVGEGKDEESSSMEVAVPIQPLKVTYSRNDLRLAAGSMILTVQKPTRAAQLVPLRATFSQDNEFVGDFPLLIDKDSKDVEGDSEQFVVGVPSGLIANKWVRVQVKEPAGLVVGATGFEMPAMAKLPCLLPACNVLIPIGRDPPPEEKPKPPSGGKTDKKPRPDIKGKSVPVGNKTDAEVPPAQTIQLRQAEPEKQPEPVPASNAAPVSIPTPPAQKANTPAPLERSARLPEPELLSRLEDIDDELKRCKPNKDNFGTCAQHALRLLRALDPSRLNEIQPKCGRSNSNWNAVNVEDEFSSDWKEDFNDCIDATIKTLKARIRAK